MTHPSLLAPWGVNDINELLRPEPLRLEMGLSRSADGLLTVAVRTDLHGCKATVLSQQKYRLDFCVQPPKRWQQAAGTKSPIHRGHAALTELKGLKSAYSSL